MPDPNQPQQPNMREQNPDPGRFMMHIELTDAPPEVPIEHYVEEFARGEAPQHRQEKS